MTNEGHSYRCESRVRCHMVYNVSWRPTWGPLADSPEFLTITGSYPPRQPGSLGKTRRPQKIVFLAYCGLVVPFRALSCDSLVFLGSILRFRVMVNYAK